MRTTVPSPDKNVEKASVGSGPVVKSQLTQEELEAIRLKYPAPAPNKKQTKPYNLPTREREEMALELTKEQYLQERLTGKTREQIAKENKVQLANLIGYHLKKWGIKDESAEEIALEDLREKPVVKPRGEVDITATIENDLILEIKHLKADNETLQNDIERYVSDNEELLRENQGYIEEIKDWATSDLERAEETMYWKDKATETVALAGKALATVREQEQSSIRFISFALPIIDGVWDKQEQRLKVQEELDETVAELESAKIDYKLAGSELLDLFQSFTGLLRVEMNNLLVDEQVEVHLQRFIQHLNQQHIAKIERYAAERGWVLQ